MVGGYMEDLTKPQNWQNGGGMQVHAQEWALACIYNTVVLQKSTHPRNSAHLLLLAQFPV